MKILDVLNEGATWTDAGWVGGASDEGHNDFDPMQRDNKGYTRPRYSAARPSNPYRRLSPAQFVAIRVPFAVKDAFKEVAGKGNFAWDGDHKTWKINAAILTPEMRQRLGDMGIEVPR